MSTECTSLQLQFPEVGRRRLVARFEGATVTSNAGALLLCAVDACTRVCRRAAQRFVDHRDPQWVEHTVEDLVTQQVMTIALGYEDLNYHDTLRQGPAGHGGDRQGGPEGGVAPAGRGPRGGAGGQEHA